MNQQRSPQKLREDLLAIWKAGVDGVRVDKLVRNAISLTSDEKNLFIEGVEYPIDEIDRIVVLGGGKASGAMAETLESILEPLFGQKEILGWINVPEDCAKSLRKIHLHPARPMGVNEPTEAAAAGTEEMLRLAVTLRPNDLCLCLISGGGSALLPAPVPEISLAEKLDLTRFLSESGATIQELNTVRKQLSRIKGGGLKRLCQGQRLVSLILSDVLGDPLDVIASGPTVDNDSTASDALDVLRKFAPECFSDAELETSRQKTLRKIVRYLEKKRNEKTDLTDVAEGFVRNLIIGNNAVAVEAAGEEALHRGYSHAMYVSRQNEGFAEDIGVHLAEMALDMTRSGPDCLIHGGEPVVKLAPPEIRGLGGRNQQLVLAALIYLLERLPENETPGVAVLSGGTDGEDGPTDAAGAWIDPIFFEDFWREKRNNPGLDPRDFLRRNDAYRFFEPFETLLMTGATGTNVCDLRVVLVTRNAGVPAK